MLKLVQSSYRSYPIISNSISGFCIFCGGDVVSQFISTKNKKAFKINIQRTIDTGILGIFMNGFCLHGWYRILELSFGASMKNRKVVILKCVADQICYAPFSICVFFSFVGVRAGGTVLEINERIYSKISTLFVSTWVADCTLWPIVNAVNFSLIPLNYRPTFVGIAQLTWMTYLAFVGNSHQDVLSKESKDNNTA